MPRDAEARGRAVDPTRNVALEASAGTGKTRVLVDRYVALLVAGAKPRNILAITFTRKAAAEMRQRILQELARKHREQALAPELWREIRENVTDISISTIDAFCLSLLREFPLEADVDPGFDLADETETPRLVGESLDRTLRVRPLPGRRRSRDGAALRRARRVPAARRSRAAGRPAARRRGRPSGGFFAARHHRTIDESIARLQARLRAAFASLPGGVGGLDRHGPGSPRLRPARARPRRAAGRSAPVGRH